MERKKITFDSFIRGVILGVIIIGILMLFKRLSGVLLPFFIAWLIAYLIYPLVTFFQYRLRLKNRVISIFCALFSILIVGGTAFYLLVPPMMDEFVRVKDLVIDYFSNGTHDGNVPKTLSEFLRENIDTQFVTQLFKEENMLNAIKETVPRLWSLLSESVNLLFSFFTFFLILLYIVFILLDYESISEGWTHLVPQKYRPFVINVMNDVKDGMNRYFRGQAFVALCVGILFSIGFLIIDFPLAIGLGLFIGALNLVPYLQIIGFIPTIVLAILKAADTGGNFWIIIASALAVFIIVQAIQDGFIVPRVMGKITGLNPAIILLSLSIWGSLMGMLGMIIALPLTTLMLSYYQRFIINKGAIAMDNKYTDGIDKFINDNRENIVRDIARLVAIDSVEGKAEPGAPFGKGPKQALELGLEICRELGSRLSTARIRSATARSAMRRITSQPSRTLTSSPSARAGRATRSRCASARAISSAAA